VASADVTYHGWVVANVSVSIIDNDLPGVTIAETGGFTQVREAGPTSDTYTIVLDSPPTSDVTVTITPDAQTDLGAGAGAATVVLFTTVGWNIARTVVVTAVDDAVLEGDHTSTLVHTVTSADGDYDGLAVVDLVADVVDNDDGSTGGGGGAGNGGGGLVVVGVAVQQTGGTTAVSEDGLVTDSYALVLQAAPVGRRYDSRNAFRAGGPGRRRRRAAIAHLQSRELVQTAAGVGDRDR
jgi:hypothetical protein